MEATAFGIGCGILAWLVLGLVPRYRAPSPPVPCIYSNYAEALAAGVAAMRRFAFSMTEAHASIAAMRLAGSISVNEARRSLGLPPLD